MNAALRKLNYIGKYRRVRSFLHRHISRIRQSVARRALERQKSAKHQVELVLAHLRNVYATEALCKIQRTNQNGIVPPKLVCFHKMIQETREQTLQSESFLKVRGDIMFCVPLVNRWNI